MFGRAEPIARELRFAPAEILHHSPQAVKREWCNISDRSNVKLGAAIQHPQHSQN
ncbi:hypothetical protein IQ252_16520 [Tychonema sp. LEGE 07203]|nr:hypothetical protein [Tychonema sp. LEGE 07203]